MRRGMVSAAAVSGHVTICGNVGKRGCFALKHKMSVVSPPVFKAVAPDELHMTMMLNSCLF